MDYRNITMAVFRQLIIQMNNWFLCEAQYFVEHNTKAISIKHDFWRHESV